MNGCKCECGLRGRPRSLRGDEIPLATVYADMSTAFSKGFKWFRTPVVAYATPSKWQRPGLLPLFIPFAIRVISQ